MLIVPFLKDEFGDDIQRSLSEAGVTTVFVTFTGECCWQEVERLYSVLHMEHVDYLISVGGGKCVDAGKLIAHSLAIPSIVMPTIASNDAPCSALSVVYTPEGMIKIVFLPFAIPEVKKLLVV